MAETKTMNDLQALDLTTTRRLLARLREWFDHGVAALAAACSANGKLSADRLDDHQVVSFELAWAGADLLAADAAVATLDSPGGALEARLALIFSVDAIAAVLSRLETLYLELNLDLAALQALACDADWAGLRRSAGGAEALASAGRALAQIDQDDIGRVVLDEPLAMAQHAFRRFAAEVVAPQAEAIHRHDRTVPETLLQPLREMGVFGLSIPERYGGSAPNDRDDTPMMLVVTEALSEASLAAAGSLITRPEILSRALLTGGTELQKTHWLPRIAAGKPLCAIAITEPDFGSDVASLSLKATRAEGGWLLDGAKTWCTFAGKAGLLMVVARTDPDKSAGHRGLSLLLVEKPSFDGHAFDFVQAGGGRLVGKAIPTIGYRGMHSFDLAFEHFFVPDANVIGEAAGLGKGFYFTMAGMMGGRMQTAARACGVMRAALRASLKYAADRKVFGAPLIDYPLTLAKLARMAARLAACRQLAYSVARRLDAGGGRMEASLVKLLACRSAESVTREALQIHGGMGYAEEMPVSRYFVDARVLSIFEGAEETLALKVITRSLLENALAPAAA
jgi:(2S)-methylsuccinyl-CoA dehydrogenase